MSEEESKKIQKMSIDEFVTLGILQEVNRRFLHTLGLALEVTLDGGKYTLSGIWDYRGDPDGIIFDEGFLNTDEARAKRDRVQELLYQHKEAREKLFSGEVIQPIEGG